MKKILVIISLFLFALQAHSQVLKPVKIDNLVTVSLPAEHKKTDTLGQQLYTGSAQFGYIIVIRAENPPNTKHLKKEKDLDKLFDEYVKKVQRSSTKGEVAEQKDTTINKLHIKDFTLETDSGAGVQIRKFRLLYTHEVIYTFEYLYDHSREELAVKEAKEFFNTIKISAAIQPTDQFTQANKPAGMNSTLKIALIAGSVVLILIIILLLARRKRRAD